MNSGIKRLCIALVLFLSIITMCSASSKFADFFIYNNLVHCNKIALSSTLTGLSGLALWIVNGITQNVLFKNKQHHSYLLFGGTALTLFGVAKFIHSYNGFDTAQPPLGSRKTADNSSFNSDKQIREYQILCDNKRFSIVRESTSKNPNALPTLMAIDIDKIPHNTRVILQGCSKYSNSEIFISFIDKVRKELSAKGIDIEIEE